MDTDDHDALRLMLVIAAAHRARRLLAPHRASQAEASPVSELRGFSKGLRKDWAAVTAGLTVSYSSGAVEGHVNRIKMIKRQMYGRAKPDLLRKRVLLAD